jgi:NADPH:quinone reductase-like Zn-dependent oxidoreductase
MKPVFMSETADRARPNSEALATLVGEIDRGALRVDVEQVLPLEEAAKGFETLALGRSSSRSTTGQLPRC